MQLHPNSAMAFGLAALLAFAGACGSRSAPSASASDGPASATEPQASGEPPPAAPTAEPTGPAVADVTRKASAAEAPNEVSSHMKDHFEAVRDIERAAVAGNVAAMRERAAWLAEHEPENSVAYKPELDAMRETASRLARAVDLQAAIPLAAELGAACGSCHQTMTTITSFEYQELPEDTGELGQRMVRHLWAVDRLWEGLVGPSTALWTSGAEVLASDPLPVEEVTTDPAAVREVTRLSSQVQRLGRLAGGADDQAARASIYGELLTTCAACHAYSTKIGKR